VRTWKNSGKTRLDALPYGKISKWGFPAELPLQLIILVLESSSSKFGAGPGALFGKKFRRKLPSIAKYRPLPILRSALTTMRLTSCAGAHFGIQNPKFQENTVTKNRAAIQNRKT
jgi:hypothetical protein